MVRRLVHFSGRVQGVGFRYSAATLAREFAISGYVQNLPDGRVELLVEGESAEVERYLTSLKTLLSRYIVSAHEAASAATGHFSGFEIRR